ncbi:hypothetical protein ATK17_3539 [Branchiibius hedensis]|uniref:MT0933-like antitoxin protein n=1 Tax=Branchiibius hedensis TaxID=672460 RepID=A0A2Y9A1S5_9MICO|nr:CsbD family protein [Branchiibius hedensis]PWJ27346.1 hypothetical protein ATK17_3539 [Branchiibius hedensis]SSA36157.1 hypothetical protein SAMN04489750_3539 [Branchiibius hedensis]
MGFLADLKDKAQQLFKTGQEKFSEAVDATEEFADDKSGGKFSEVKGKVGDFVEDSKDKIGELVGEGKEKLSDLTAEAGDKADGAVDAAQDSVEDKLAD